MSPNEKKNKLSQLKQKIEGCAVNTLLGGAGVSALVLFNVIAKTSIEQLGRSNEALPMLAGVLPCAVLVTLIDGLVVIAAAKRIPRPNREGKIVKEEQTPLCSFQYYRDRKAHGFESGHKEQFSFAIGPDLRQRMLIEVQENSGIGDRVIIRFSRNDLKIGQYEVIDSGNWGASGADLILPGFRKPTLHNNEGIFFSEDGTSLYFQGKVTEKPLLLVQLTPPLKKKTLQKK